MQKLPSSVQDTVRMFPYMDKIASEELENMLCLAKMNHNHMAADTIMKTNHSTLYTKLQTWKQKVQHITFHYYGEASLSWIQ